MKNARCFNTVSMNTDIYINPNDLLGNTAIIKSMETTHAIRVAYFPYPHIDEVIFCLFTASPSIKLYKNYRFHETN